MIPKGKLLSPGHQPQQLSVLAITVPVLSATTATTAVDTEHKYHYGREGHAVFLTFKMSQVKSDFATLQKNSPKIKDNELQLQRSPTKHRSEAPNLLAVGV